MDGFDKYIGASGLPMGVSNQLRRFFDMSQDPTFIQQHNDRLRRRWDKSNPTHVQVVYSLFNVVIEGVAPFPIFKPFPSPALHHQYYFQAEKELEYWAVKYLGQRVTAAFYVRSYVGDTDQWVYIETKTISLDLPKPPPVAVAKAIDH